MVAFEGALGRRGWFLLRHVDRAPSGSDTCSRMFDLVCFFRLLDLRREQRSLLFLDQRVGEGLKSLGLNDGSAHSTLRRALSAEALKLIVNTLLKG